jgi:hypothetical protein
MAKSTINVSYIEKKISKKKTAEQKELTSNVLLDAIGVNDITRKMVDFVIQQNLNERL